MNKPNDFLAANLNAPENFTLSDFYIYGLTPDNTGLKSKDDYKNIKQVQDTFKKDNGEFDDLAFDSFYDSVSRMYNDWAQTDFAKNIMSSIPRSREDISDINNTNIRNTDTKLFSLNDPWRHQRGMGNVYSLGKESFDIREVAQANKVHDADGNELDYTANDTGLFRNPFKTLFGKPLVLAEDENGELLLNKDGDPYYRELKKGESTYGKQTLHITDTLTKDDSWLNKFDFFDNDGLDKSVIGTIMNTAARVGPYLIPYVGPVLGAIDAARGLATAMPALAKAVNGMITNDSDNTSFGKAMNSIEGYMQRFGTSKSRYSQEHNWSFENIGDMVATSAAQLFQQRTFSYIPWLLGMEDTEKATKIGQALSLGFMAATSAEDSLETFKEAGLSDRMAGVAMLGYTSALYWMMNKDYFKDQLFKNSWLNSSPEMRNILRQNNKEAARIALASIENAAKPGATRMLTQEEIKRESTNVFNKVWNATVNAWKTKSWSPFKDLDLVAPGSAFAQGNVYLNRALNEGVEEVMEEGLLDIGKVITLGLESLGFNIKDETKEKLDYGLSVNDVLQRYTTAFIGGAIGGAVFEGLDKYNSRRLNKNTSDYAGRGLNGELIRIIRNNGADKVLAELETLREAGKLGNKNLGVHGRFVTDPTDNKKQVFIFDAGSDSDNQNNMMYNIMKIRIQAIDAAMHNLGIYQDDNTIIKGITDEIEESAKKAGMDTKEYMRVNKRDVFSEFVQKTGFADIILNDIGNLEIDALDYDAKIEEEKAKILSRYSDAEKSAAEEEINKSKIIKEWTKKRDEKLKLREDIISGKATGNYIKYANFAAHDSYVSKVLGKEDNTKMDVAYYAWTKYHVTYDALSDTAKAVMDEDYVQYQKLNGIDALYAANELFQNVTELLKPYLEKNPIEGYNFADDLSESVIGDYDSVNPELIDPRIILNRKYNKTDYHPIVDALLDPKTVTPKNIDNLIDSIRQYYKYINDHKIIAEYGDDWVEYANSRLIDALTEGFDRNALDEAFKNALLDEQYRANEAYINDLNNDPNENPDVDPVKFDSAVNDNTTYIREPLYNDVTNRSIYIDKLKSIIPNLISDPEKALEQLNDLTDVLSSSINQDSVLNQVINAIIKPYENIAKRVIAANNERAKMVHSPVIELAQVISYELNGTEIPILDEIARQKAALTSKTNTSEYLITSESAKKQLEAAKKILPLLETVLHSAMFSNQFANQFLEDAEKLPVIDRNLYSLYVDDFHFLSNKIDFLLKLNDMNKNAKVREQILVRKNFIHNVVNRLLQKTIDGEVNPIVDKLQKSMRNIDFDKLWSEAGGDGLDLESDDQQVEVMSAFTKFEHLIYEHVKNNVKDLSELGKGIALTFDDSYKMKNGILSSDSNDDIENFDLMTYLLTVVGVDSYTFGRKLKSKFEGDGKFPFYGQELAIRFAYVGINSPELINGALNGIRESTNKAIKNSVIQDVDEAGRKLDELDKTSIDYLNDKSTLFNTIVIDGFAGVGKSTVIAKMAYELSDNIEVVAVSKDINRAKALGSQFGSDNDHVKTLDQLLSDVLGKPFVNSDWITKFRGHDAKLKSTKEDEYVPIETDAKFGRIKKDANKKLVIVIDECTQLSEGQWQMLVDAAKKEGVIIVGLGNTMQTGATVDKNNVNLDDCVYLSTSKLTISMRTANAGKNENNLKVGTLAKIVADLQKDNPTYSTKILSGDLSLNQEVTLAYADNNGRVSGDMIVTKIEDSDIDRIVNASNEDETIVVITDNDFDFTVSRIKYADAKTSNGEQKVTFAKEETVGGSEFDFAIINVPFDNDPSVKIIDIKRLYTLITRAKKGSVLVNSKGLSDSLYVTSAISPTAASETTFQPDSDVATQYKESRLAALNTIPAEEPASEIKSESESVNEEDIEDSDLSKNEDGSEKVSAEEVINDVDEEIKDTKEDDLGDDANDDLTDYWITAGAVRGYKAKQYIRRKYLLSQRETNLINSDTFVDWLANADNKLSLPYSGLNTDNPEAISNYKKFIKVFSSILLTKNSLEDRSKAFEDRALPILNENRGNYRASFISDLQFAFENSNGVFFLQKMKDSDTEMMVYYCFNDKWTIPVSIVNLSQTNVNNEGFYKNLTFKQETGIIPVSSNGRRRSKVSETVGNFVEVVQDGDNPITAIFTPPADGVSVKTNRKNQYFLNNTGKAFIGLSSESGLTSDEAKQQWNPVKTEEGEIDYFVQDSTGNFALAGVQEDIDADQFFKVLEAVKILIGSNPDSDGNEGNVRLIADFFGVDVNTVKSDFRRLFHNDPNLSAIESAKQFGKIRNQYSILFKREIELMTSAIIQYCTDNDPKALEYLTENLYTLIGPSYTSKTNGTVVRTNGLRITAYDNKHKSRRFEIVPNATLTEFYIYESNFGGVRTTDEKPIATISGDSFITDRRVDHRKLISTAWETIIDNTDVSAKTGFTKALRNRNLDNDTIDSLIKSGDLSLSLTTESHSSEDGDIIKYFSPFESRLLDLTSYPKSLGKEGRFINDAMFMDMLKKSSIFTYGIYRQILAKDPIGSSELWRTGQVGFDKLTWDIVKVLAPVYSVTFTEVNADTDTNHSVGEYLEKFHNLRTLETGNQSTIITTGNAYNFSPSLKITDDWKKLFEDSVLNSLLAKNAVLTSATFGENEISLSFKYDDGSNHVRRIDISEADKLESLLEGIDHNKINPNSVKRMKFLTKIGNVEFIGSDSMPDVRINGQVEKVNKAALNIENEIPVLYITTDKSGLTRLEITGDISTIDAFITPLRETNQEFGNYIGNSEEGYSYYYDKGPIINVIVPNENGYKLFIKGVTDNSIIAVDSQGLPVEIPFALLPNPKLMMNKFNKDLLSKTEGNPMLIKANGLLRTIGGTLMLSRDVASQISNYDALTDATLESIDFNTNEIVLNGKSYTLDSVISEKTIDAWFGDFYGKGDPGIINRIKGKFTKLMNKLPDFEVFIQTINSENLIPALNDYLQRNALTLGSIYSVSMSKSGNLMLSQDVSAKSAIKLAVAKQYGGVNVNDIPDFNIDPLKSQDFSLTLSDGSKINGTVKKVNDEWVIDFTTDIDITFESLEQKLNELSQNPDVSNQDIEYFRYRLDVLSGKTKSDRAYTMYSVNLAKRVAANPDSLEARFYRELTNYNEKCKVG